MPRTTVEQQRTIQDAPAREATREEVNRMMENVAFYDLAHYTGWASHIQPLDGEVGYFDGHRIIEKAE